jgi:hypothetical protein
MSKPIDLMIVGAQKAGTTSLLRYLGNHPVICIHNQIELMFFLLDIEYIKGYEYAFEHYFHHCNDKGLLFAKNVGIMYWPKAIKRLKEHNPHIHLVLILRNPVDRAYSAYWFARREGWENIKIFEEALKAEEIRKEGDAFKWRQCLYLERGNYYKHIVKIFEHFRKEQVHVYLFEDLTSDPMRVCKEICSIFGLNYNLEIKCRHNVAAIARSEMLAYILRRIGQSGSSLKKNLKAIIPDSLKKSLLKLNKVEFTPPLMKEETKKALIEFYKEPNHMLSELIGKDLSGWSR